MMWLELLGGFIVAFCGVALIVDAANSTTQTIEDERYAIYGLLALVIGGMFFMLGFAQLGAELVNWAFA